MKIKILFTKKISKKTKNLLKNFEVKETEFLKISPILNQKKISFLKNYKNPFIFTSSNSLESIKNIKNFKKKKCFVKEWKPYSLAKNYNFEILESWKNSDLLAKKIKKYYKKNLEKKEFLHITTKNHRKEIYDFAKKNNFKIKNIFVYSKKNLKKKINFFYDAIVFFSPSIANNFLQKNILEKEKIIFCIWNTTKKFLQQKNIKNKIIIPKNPTQESIAKEILNFYK